MSKRIGKTRLAAIKDVALLNLKYRCVGGRVGVTHGADCGCIPPSPLAQATLDLLEELQFWKEQAIHCGECSCEGWIWSLIQDKSIPCAECNPDSRPPWNEDTWEAAL